jgi:hypothetical protein
MSHRGSQTGLRDDSAARGIMETLMHRYAIGGVLALVLAAPAAAQVARTWIFDDNPEMPVLMFGAPDSDDLLLTLSCDPNQKRMTIVESVVSKKMNPGGTATFKLTAGTASLDLTGDAVANESDGTVSIEVTGPPNPRVFALLKGGPSLTIEVPGAKETIPLAAAAPHVPNFEKLCAGPK